MLWEPDKHGITPAIDEQHKRIFKIIADFVEALAEAMTPGAAQAPFTLVELSDYAKEHFAFEEALLRGIGYPGLEAHEAAHQELLDRLDKIAESFRLNGPGTPEDVLDLLDHWMNDHILGDDMAYKVFINAKLKP
jgi:hemerythrin